MAGLFNALNSARTSLEVNQKAIEITGNNISNVNTEGYSRQSAVYETYPAVNFGDFFVGQGVKISDVERDHNVFIEQQIISKSSDYGYQSSMTDSLAQLEQIFTIGEDNISTDIDSFFDSLQELTADPSDLVLRNSVILQGDVLATSFNNAIDDLSTIQDNINDSILSKIETVNSTLAAIADLNDRIYSIEIQGQTANSARDQREALAKEMAQTLGAQTYEDTNGMLSVVLPGGLPLVQGNMAMTLTGEVTGSDLNVKLQAGGVERTIDGDQVGGEFAGLLYLRDDFIPELKGDLDKLAYEITVQFNLQHMAGGALDSTTGNLFFDMPPNYDPLVTTPTATEYEGAARAMSVAITDPNKVAAGEASSDVAPGDNSNALILSNIGDTYLVDGTDTFTSLYGRIAAKVGVEASQNDLNLQGAEDALVQLENFRDSYSGVSLEEEMINLIQFQRGFESSAKFLSTVDEMMTTVINIKQ